jgi:subtilisin family serine protease
VETEGYRARGGEGSSNREVVGEPQTTRQWRDSMPRRLFLAVLVAGLVVSSASPAWSASDPSRSKQWALSRIQAVKSWATSKGAGVTIAIVDTGIDLTHPDLKSKIAGHYTCIDGSCKSGGNDDEGHGSHVAGIAAAATNNGIGISGVAPAAKLMAVKVLKSDGKGDCNDIKLGVKFAVNHGARVINLSLGPEFQLLDLVFGSDCVQLVEDAASYAYGKGAVVVVAAGNDSLRSAYSSSALEVVGATGANDRVASYSSTGADVYAPGGDGTSCSPSNCIYSTWMNGGYRSEAGTSMSAPHVSGVAAQLLSMGYTNAQAINRINGTADIVNGIKRLDAARAVGPPPAPAPSATHATSSPGISTAPSSVSHAASISPKPSVKKSAAAPKVLAVTPTKKPSAVTQAAGARPASKSSRALPIAIASGLLACMVIAGFVLRSRIRASRSA